MYVWGGGAPESQSPSATSYWVWSCLTSCSQGSAGVHLSALPHCCRRRPVPGFYLGSGIWTQVLRLHSTSPLSHLHRPKKGCFLKAVSIKDQKWHISLLYSTAKMQVTITKSCGHALSDCVVQGGLKPVILSALSASIGVCQHAHFNPYTFFWFSHFFQDRVPLYITQGSGIYYVAHAGLKLKPSEC